MIKFTVLRGGSWYRPDPELLLAGYRNGFKFAYENNDIGFRCIRRKKKI